MASRSAWRSASVSSADCTLRMAAAREHSRRATAPHAAACFRQCAPMSSSARAIASQYGSATQSCNRIITLRVVGLTSRTTSPLRSRETMARLIADSADARRLASMTPSVRCPFSEDDGGVGKTATTAASRWSRPPARCNSARIAVSIRPRRRVVVSPISLFGRRTRGRQAGGSAMTGEPRPR